MSRIRKTVKYNVHFNAKSSKLGSWISRYKYDCSDTVFQRHALQILKLWLQTTLRYTDKLYENLKAILANTKTKFLMLNRYKMAITKDVYSPSQSSKNEKANEITLMTAGLRQQNSMTLKR